MSTFWTNPSVRQLGGDHDPEQEIIERARQLALEAISEGWSGPPYDPFELAEWLRIPVVAREDLYDARLVIGDDGRRIEYNPGRPRGRVRFTIAHELAHTLFPDAAKQIRWRSAPVSLSHDDWQVEMLCNIAAGELLMPTGSFPEFGGEELEISHLMELRREYDVSTEALLLRIVRLTDEPLTVFAASRDMDTGVESPLRVQYTRGSRVWTAGVRRGMRVPRSSPVYDCLAVGFTAAGIEEWPGAGEVQVQAVGASPYPGQRLPRVLGLLRPTAAVPRTQRDVQYVHGDATQPRGEGCKVIAHVVNDRTPNWGGAFSRALRDRFPTSQADFRSWVRHIQAPLSLGAVHVADVAQDVCVATLVAQHGYGPSTSMRLRYDALRSCLSEVGVIASDRSASVHMPLIGAGMACGDWEIISELVVEELVARDLSVTVYLLPDAPMPTSRSDQMKLPLAAA